tara:strand:+ start:654 stop:941 length:288 start_codon:yes stop_codon:yes gene_type:complete
MMEIKLDMYEVEQALFDYIEVKYGLDCSENFDRDAGMFVKMYRPEYVWKKHKNGRYVKDEHGARVVDWKKTTFKKEYAHIFEDDELQICLSAGGE